MDSETKLNEAIELLRQAAELLEWSIMLPDGDTPQIGYMIIGNEQELNRLADILDDSLWN